MKISTTRSLSFTGLALLLLASCDADPVAGTTDEAQTSLQLQLVADNLRPIPGDQNGAGAMANRALAPEASDSACLPQGAIHEARYEEEDSGAMRWRIGLRDRTRWGCRERHATLSQEHGRAPETEWWAVDTNWMVGGDPAEVRGSASALTRMGFRYRLISTITPSQQGSVPDQVVQTIILDDLGWTATFRWRDGEHTPAFVQGTPLLHGDLPVGRLAIDTLTGNFRVFNLEGREYFRRAQSFPQVAADSLGVRVIGIRRDTVDGTEGLRVELSGRLPADSGLSLGATRLSFFAGPAEERYIETGAAVEWPARATSASLFFPGFPLRATHIRVGGAVVWDRPIDPAILHTGEFLTRILPLP